MVGGDLAYDAGVAARQSVELIDAGVTHILDVRHEAHDADWWGEIPEITYLSNGIDDAGQEVPGAWFDAITDWAVAAIDAGGTVLTHCHAGINRGPSAGYAVLLRLGWDPVEAIAAIRSARPIANAYYAEDALNWHLDRTAASPAERYDAITRLEAWRAEHPLDIVRLVRDRDPAPE